MEHNQSTLTAEQTTSQDESQDKEMSEKQQQQAAAQHILNSIIICELLIDIFKKTEDEQRACIIMETLDILPKLESNLEKSYALIN